MFDHDVPKENLITSTKPENPGNEFFDRLALWPIQMITFDTKPEVAGDSSGRTVFQRTWH